MSYDFTRNHHIGMTPEGYHDGNRMGAGYRRPRNTGRISLGNGNWQIVDMTQKPPVKRAGPFVDFSTHDLRQLCFAGNADAIAEWEYRHTNGKF